MKKRVLCGFLALIFIITCLPTAFAEDSEPVSSFVRDGFIVYNYDCRNAYELPSLSSGKTIIYNGQAPKTPGIVIQEIYPVESMSVQPFAYGDGYPVARIVTSISHSNGLSETGYKSGTFSSVASLLLSFVPGIPAMTVSQILSSVGLIAGSNDQIVAKTFTSQRYTYRDGQARWSSDPNSDSYYAMYFRTGKVETFRHIYGAVWDETTNSYKTKSYDYPSPSLVETTANYNQSDSWLMNQTVQNAWLGSVTIETWF